MADDKSKIVTDATGPDAGPAPVHPEAGITNAGAYMRKMALNGYILHVDLAPVRELVSLQQRCANNLNQVAVHANTFGVYPEEIAGLQRDYEKLWEQVSDVLTELSALVKK